MVGARRLLAELDELLKLDQAIRILVGRRGSEEKKIRRGRNAQMIPILRDGLVTKRIGSRLDRLAGDVRPRAHPKGVDLRDRPLGLDRPRPRIDCPLPRHPNLRPLRPSALRIGRRVEVT